MRNEFDANTALSDMSAAEENALSDLLCFVDDGMEYPDAEWKVCKHHSVKVDRLRAMYDAQCIHGY